MTVEAPPKGTMSTTITAPASPLIGHYLPEIQSLAKRGILWGVLYGVFARRYAGGCLGSDDASDAVCYTAALHPSPLVWLAMAVVFVVAIGRMSKATGTRAIKRIFLWAATAMWVIPLAVAVLSFWAFFSASPDAWVLGTPPPNVTVQIDMP